MKYISIVVLYMAIQVQAIAQTDWLVLPEPATVDLQFLVAEVMMNSPEIQAEVYQMDIMGARIPQAQAFDDPEIMLSSEEMPGFSFHQAMYQRIGLTQTFRFPSKFSAQGKIAELRAEHAHHNHQEKTNEVIAKLKSSYFELWFVQQKKVLNQENIRLMKQFSQVALSKYGVGLVPQQDVLKAQIELAMLQNEQITLRQQEFSTKAMLMAILNRAPKDTIGFAIIPEDVSFDVTLDSLTVEALRSRPMLRHDSLSIEESTIMLELAKKEYIPDFKIGLEHVTSPATGFSGWGISAGITLPFAPWVLGKTNGRTDEATAMIKKAASTYDASRNMVRSSVSDLYYKASAYKQQLDNFRMTIIPQAEQILNASLTAYQTGSTSFLMLIDAYRSRITLMSEYFMTRMRLEQTISGLEFETGQYSLSSVR